MLGKRTDSANNKRDAEPHSCAEHFARMGGCGEGEEDREDDGGG